MKRSIGTLLYATLATGAFAQANFTIVRPADGSRVREKVHVLFPKGSIPSGGYVGIFLDGQLVDALVPQVKGKYQEYVLDTKGRGIKDTDPGKPIKLEAKLYVNYNDQPRIVKTSSVDINIGNEANIRIPNGGVKLRYRYVPGTELVYSLQQRVTVDTISEDENKKGGKPAELPIDSYNSRTLYAVENAYPNGDGLLRIQALPEKGKSYAVLTAASITDPNPQPKVFYEDDMASVYMRATPTGREVFGEIPVYFPLEGTSGQGNPLSLFRSLPLPTLPEKAVRPGDSWQSRFQRGKIDLEKLFNQTSIVKTFPARGEFVRTEWEMGHPCALIKNTIEAAQQSDQDRKLAKTGSPFAGEKVKLSESIWFALDTRQVVKVIRDETLETKVENGMGGGGFMGAPGGGYPGGGYPGGGRPSGMPGVPGGGGAKADLITPLNQRRPSMQGGRGGPSGFPGRPGGFPGAPGGYPGGPGGYPGAGRNGASGASQAQYVRVRTQSIFVLEK